MQGSQLQVIISQQSHLISIQLTFATPYFHTSIFVTANPWRQSGKWCCWWKHNLVEVGWDSSTIILVPQAINNGGIIFPNCWFPNYSGRELGRYIFAFFSYTRKCINKNRFSSLLHMTWPKLIYNVFNFIAKIL